MARRLQRPAGVLPRTLKARSRPADTGILNKKGGFDARRFGKIFGRWARLDVDGAMALTSADLARMIAANRQGLAGYVTAMAEWQLLLAFAADTRAVEAGRTVPAVSVARIRAFYEGTLFYDLARERA